MRLVVVVPCYNEQDALPFTIGVLQDKLAGLMRKEMIDASSRLLFVDDGSSDATWDIIKNTGSCMESVQGIRFSRNEGHQNALMAGMRYAYCEGADAVITIDADLQQDVDAIDDFLEKYRRGADIIYGIRNSRQTDGLFKKLTAGLFYRMMSLLGARTVKNHADYRLLSRNALSALLEYGETQLYLRGMVSTLGFTEDRVYFDVKERENGKSKYSVSKMLALAFNGITSFSIGLIHMIFMVGIAVTIASFVMIIYNIIIWAKGMAVPGWASILCSIWFFGGLNFIFIGIIGEYVGKSYMEMKRRPLFHVRERVNIDGQN